ncbi:MULTISPECIES: MarR family winged helix-turn-helix transcriptional regulator [Nocardiopsis]|uniref:MarR family transcriptional regulator n=2 Tax=Nocardiopsis alba TaxID=53437 RepID=A0A7K2ISE1_9ACTN|nr:MULTISPECIES: MarR family transcriptional regulator [Nocardiopsis]AFR11071.1 penicillinase repressor family protein [Nocardiopsis alba ATCC BAA-2165]MEC3893248.1 MarR family transcriptional regulator [Nocardiopsis sp. LDBS1602]MYR32861.1 MarR family transcriptional regulator [Nocardiopsis alba]
MPDRDPAQEGDFELPRVDEQMCFALYAASRAVTNLYRPLLDPLGLTYPQYLVMMLLWERGECSVKEIGAVLQLDYGTLTPLLKRLETNGLLRRERDPEDERSVRVTLTEEGAALRERARGVPEAIGRVIDLPEEEFEATRLALRRLTTNVLAGEARVTEGP